MENSNNSNKYPAFPSESDYEAAWANASYWVRKRFVKKTSKVKWRAAYWSDGKELDPADPGYKIAGVRKKRLPPADLMKYISNFVKTHGAKGATNEKS